MGRHFHSLPKPDYAGLREYGHSNVDVAIIGLYDGELAGLDTEGGRWQTVCETHGTICSHRTYKQARQFLPFPHEWCDACRSRQEAMPEILRWKRRAA